MPFQRPRVIRPPSEAYSYFLPLTGGCSNNTCGFCNYYYGSKLQVRDLDEVKREIEALDLYARTGVRLPDVPNIVYRLADQWDGKKIFLQDADALVYPVSKLIDVLKYIGEKLPSVERIATYGTAQDVLRRTTAELAELKRLKLGIIYIGLESGDDEILKMIDKGIDAEHIIEAGRKIKDAGILSSVTVILGLGGVPLSERHALATARALTRMDPDYAGALTLTLVEGTPMYDRWQKGDFQPVTPFRSLEELVLIIENSTFTNCFFSSMHASNYFSLRGTLPQDKERLLAELRRIISQGDPRLLKPEYFRGL